MNEAIESGSKPALLWRAVLVPLSVWFSAQAAVRVLTTVVSIASGEAESLRNGWYGPTALAISVLSAAADAVIAACLFTASRAVPHAFLQGARHIERAAWVYACSTILLGVGSHIALCVELSRTVGPTLAGMEGAPSTFAGFFFEIGRFSSVLFDVIGAAIAIWLARRVHADWR